MATLGRTGLKVAQLGYGSMGLRGPNTWGVRVVSDDDAEAFLHRVLDSGINFIDTSPDYGVSEERIGRFLSSRRDEFFLATKCGCDPVQHADHLEVAHTWTKDVLRRNVETSLKRLQCDTIDVLQFHGGEAHILQQRGLIDTLEDFRAEGLIRFLGVSSSLPQLPAMIALGVFDTFQIPFSCLAPQHGALIKQAGESGAGIILRGGVAQGGPDAEIQRPALNEVWEQANLEELLPQGMTKAQMILRFTLSHRYCHTTIVGTCNPQHLNENLHAAEAGPLDETLLAEISSRVAKVQDK